jgi:hypothetical protein
LLERQTRGLQSRRVSLPLGDADENRPLQKSVDARKRGRIGGSTFSVAP